MFIQTETTPNPNTIKFLPGQEVTGSRGPYDYASAEETGTSRLAASLFEVSGVARVFLGSDFIAITKTDEADWKQVRPLVLAGIMDYFMAGFSPFEAAETQTPAYASLLEEGGETAEIVQEILDLIETRVRPAVAKDGGDIIFQHFDVDTGVVQLSLRGACSGCPSSTLTLKQGIETMLKAYVPEVTAVEAVL